MIGLYPFGWQACFESQKLTEAKVRIWLTMTKEASATLHFEMCCFVWNQPHSLSIPCFYLTHILTHESLTSKTHALLSVSSANDMIVGGGSSGSLPVEEDLERSI